jgi:hypothetical protein
MKIRHLPGFGLGVVVGCSVLFLAVVPSARAQSGNISDMTGNIITTSDIVGGALIPGAEADGTAIAFTSNQVAIAVNTAANSVNRFLAASNLPVVETGPPTAIPAIVQQNLQCLLSEVGNVNACVAQFQSALATAGVDATLAANLASSLRGLTSGGTVNAAQFTAVVAAYNAVINASDAQLLLNPPEQLRAIQAVLSILLNAAFTAAG